MMNEENLASPDMVFSRIRGPILGVPVTRTIVFWGLSWGPI